MLFKIYVHISGAHCIKYDYSYLQDEGEKKEGEVQKEEQEHLGKLEFSLDYNFTDAQVPDVLKCTITGN